MPKGIPLSGDRSAWDAADYPEKHANDVDTADGIHHTIGTDAGQVAPGTHTHIEADITDLDHTDANAIHDNVAGEIAAIEEKTTPADADVTVIEDSEAGNAKKRLSWSNIKATLKSYFDGIYAALSHTHTETDITDLDHDAVKVDGIGVDLTGIADGDALVYDEYEDKIVPGEGGGGGASSLNDLTDVDLTGLADGDVLVFDETSGDWLPETPAGGSITVEEQDGTPSVSNVNKIKVTNGTLTDAGSGVVSLDFGSAATDGAAIHDNEANEISAITEKTTPIDNDLLIIEDSEASYVKKSLKIGNLPSASGTDDDAIHDNVSGEISAITEKTSPVSNDILMIEDSQASNAKKKVLLKSLFGHNPDIPPATPGTYDDEFLGSSLDGDWSVVENTAADVDFSNDWHSWLKLYFSGNQVYEITKIFEPGGNFSVTAKFTMPFQANYQGVKIGAYETDMTDGIVSVFEYSARVVLQLGSKDGGKENWNRISRYYSQDGRNTSTSTVYLHLQRETNDWITAVSFDGLSFYRLGSAYSKTFTVGKLRIRIAQEGATIPCLCGIDWVRYNWITV